MKIQPYKCDSCGKLKGETNHWWLLRMGTESVHLYVWATTVGEVTPDAGNWVKHICSQACAIHVVAKWMSERR